MLKIENTEVIGLKAAIRGIRDPMNPREKSDSGICFDTIACHTCRADRNHCKSRMENKEFVVGYEDMNLMTSLRNSGTDHCKFMRMITVYLDITAPLYWWKEFDTYFDTYKVSTVVNPCSSMNNIADKEFTFDDFSVEHLLGREDDPFTVAVSSDGTKLSPIGLMLDIVSMLNGCRAKYLETKDEEYWWHIIQLLPSSYNQRRTVMLNYEVLANIYKSIQNYKLDEWHTFCQWIDGLPYSELIKGKG